MDQFLVYGDEYKTVREAVAKALMDGEVEQIEEVLEVFLYYFTVQSSFQVWLRLFLSKCFYKSPGSGLIVYILYCFLFAIIS